MVNDGKILNNLLGYPNNCNLEQNSYDLPSVGLSCFQMHLMFLAKQLASSSDT